MVDIDMPDAGNEYESPPKETQVINFNVNDANIAERKKEFAGLVITADNLEPGKKAKKVLTKMRTTLADAHKEQKADALAFGRTLDAEKNRLLALIAEVEDPISEKLTEIKDAEAKKEQDRLNAIEMALVGVASAADDRFDLTLEELESRYKTVEGMDVLEEVYQEQLDRAQTYKEDALMKLRIQINKVIEEAKETARQAAIAKENEEKQAALDKEREEFEEQKRKAAAEQAEKDRVQKEKDDAEAAERQKVLDKQAEEQAAKQKELDDEAARLAKEAADRDAAEEAEAQRIADEEQAERDRIAAEELAAAQAPDKEKLLAYSKQINELCLFANKPVMQSEAGREILFDAVNELLTIVERVIHKAEEL